MLLKAEFLAISLVLVYVGAVMVLFLFVVMMLDINVEALREGFWKHFPLAGQRRRADRVGNGGRADGWLPAAEEPRAMARRRRRGCSTQHQGARQAAVHRVPVPAGDRRRAAAGGHHRRHRADPAPAQGLTVQDRSVQVRGAEPATA